MKTLTTHGKHAEKFKKRMKPKQIDIINRVCQAMKFNGLNDTATKITKNDLNECKDKIEALRDEIVSNIPRDFTKRLREGIDDGLHLIVCLRQLLRYTKHRLIAQKKYKWNKHK